MFVATEGLEKVDSVSNICFKTAVAGRRNEVFSWRSGLSTQVSLLLYLLGGGGGAQLPAPGTRR